jgi:hypothetical protein
MALDTYTNLIASVASWATYADLTPQMPDFVAWADQEIGSRLRANFMLAMADVAVSAETAPLPSDFLAPKRFYLDVTPRVQIRFVDAGTALDMSSEFGSATYPLAAAVEASNFRFAPLFSESATGKLLYYARPPALGPSTATNILAKYPYLYLYGALEALFRYKEDDNNCDRYGAQFGGLIESINALERKDTISGPLSVGPVSGGTP